MEKETERLEAREKGEKAADYMVLAITLAQTFNSKPDPAIAADNFLNLVESIASDFDFGEDGLTPVERSILRDTFRDKMIRYGVLAKALATGEPFDPSDYENSFLRPDL